jgi:hypothetical protein
VWIEAPEERSLPALLAPALRATLLKLSRGEALRDGAKRAMRALAGFAKALKVTYSDIEVGIDLDPEPGVADSGDLENDLSDLLGVIGEAAAERATIVVIYIDELQYVPEAQLAALITALHRASQRQLPVTMVAAGLPQLLGQMGRAKSYAERLFEYIPIDKLDPDAARKALCVPAEKEGVTFGDGAPSPRSPNKRKGIRTSFRSGASTAGILLRHPPLTATMPDERPLRPSASSTRASSGSGSTD